MNTKQRIMVVLVLAISLMASGCGPGQPFGPAFTSTPAFTPKLTFTPPHTYSDVLATYPSGASLCKTVADITATGTNGEPSSFDGTFYGFDFKCYGIKLTAKVPITIGGVSYPVGTMITVDKDKNYIVVSGWD